MSDLDLYVEALTEGTVLGVAVGATDDEVANVLGTDFLDDVRKKRMRRDYGLIELYFHREGYVWRCAGITLQVHRLAGATDLVPAPLAERYGAFRPLVPFAEVSAEVRARGRELVRESLADDFGHFHLSGTTAHLTAVRDQCASEPSFTEVWSIELRSR
jgi:hypothetical protein